MRHMALKLCSDEGIFLGSSVLSGFTDVDLETSLQGTFSLVFSCMCVSGTVMEPVQPPAPSFWDTG